MCVCVYICIYVYIYIYILISPFEGPEFPIDVIIVKNVNPGLPGLISPLAIYYLSSPGRTSAVSAWVRLSSQKAGAAEPQVWW